jgi:cytochrome c-type biogenesis protein CcmH/NrfG
MSNETNEQPTSGSTWQATHVYVMAVICLLVGLVIGYLFRGSKSPAAAAQAITPAQTGAPAAGVGGHMPSLEEMKQMADKTAAPLLEQLRSDPANPTLLIQVGGVYKSTHQFKDALGYYDQALKIDPKNVPLRVEMASCMYYIGDVDGAIGQLQQALHYSPKDANSLFNLGMIKWQGKQDTKGALAAWHELLKSNPQLSADRKAQVQKLIADAQMQGKS